MMGSQRAICRFCEATLTRSFVDLGMSPLSNAYLTGEQLSYMEPFYPLRAFVCDSCFLVQLEQYETPAHLFGDYAYFSSYAESWLAHARMYVDSMIDRFGLDSTSQVVEIASNDGYLLQYFQQKDVPVLGVEPAANVAAVARAAGIPTIVKFFGVETARELASEGHSADLLIGNNVLAHVPDLNDFVAGFRKLLKVDGIVTLEFPHLLELVLRNEFDTIYHEHFSYFSFLTAESVLAKHGLTVFDVQQLPTHGGSLRLFARNTNDASRPVTPAVALLRKLELDAGLRRVETYGRFAEQVKETKRNLLEFLIAAKRAGKSIAGYGAPAKGNTLLNYCGIGNDFLDYTVDRNPRKQGRYLPGSHLPICNPDRVRETRPDYLLILPWNLKDEVMQQMAFVREWGGRFVVPIPRVEVLP
jgi:2-polyprenyl-3-methyl-5-hydroxy-6-metoxy-1,4-benzoquinol methylase